MGEQIILPQHLQLQEHEGYRLFFFSGALFQDLLFQVNKQEYALP